MIKMLGVCIILLGATVMGVCASSSLTNRARTLNSFMNALDIMRSEINERLTPLYELMIILGDISSYAVASFFKACAEEMKKKPDIPFAIIWRKNLKHADYLQLKAGETEAISALGEVLGRYSAKEQSEAIEHTLRNVETMAQNAENTRQKLGGLYTKLGVICGIAVVIVFI